MSKTDTTTGRVFRLSCTDCEFADSLTTNLQDVLDVADAHQDDHGPRPMDHFVNIEQESH